MVDDVQYRVPHHPYQLVAAGPLWPSWTSYTQRHRVVDFGVDRCVALNYDTVTIGTSMRSQHPLAGMVGVSMLQAIPRQSGRTPAAFSALL